MSQNSEMKRCIREKNQYNSINIKGGKKQKPCKNEKPPEREAKLMQIGPRVVHFVHLRGRPRIVRFAHSMGQTPKRSLCSLHGASSALTERF